MSHPFEVLFVCVHNTGRSQMAAALLDHHGCSRVRARSAGTAPALAVHPAIVAVMAELGIDLSRAIPTLLTDDALQAATVIVTMGCGDTLPIYPGTRCLDWDLDDPTGKTLEQIRPLRDAIDARVRALLYSLGVAARVGLLN